MRHLVPRIEFPELVIGLVSPIGTPLADVIRHLSAQFSAVGYAVHELRVTDTFQTMSAIISPTTDLASATSEQRYESYIAYGNQLREQSGDRSILAALSIQTIVEKRLAETTRSAQKFLKNLYILHQFKRPEEIELLRSVYGKLFFQISVYSRRSARVDYLARKFAEDHSKADYNPFRSSAERLVDTDENQRLVPSGQRVGKIFHNADFIVNTDLKSPSTSDQVERFSELVLSSNTITPMKCEYGMFAAKSAALRTSDLSRQVGAAIFSASGEILALGSNEVPKANGGTYWPDDEFDDREFKRKIDSNDQRKREILSEVLKILEIDKAKIGAEKLKKLDDSSMMDALEYGRIIHAEMSAITDAARSGRNIGGSILYTTTFPCHMCAKHIVSAGIRMVYYLEPYPKSLAARLHSDSILIEGMDRGAYTDFPAVEFVHFFGVTPRRYREFFERSRRKNDDGELVEYIDDKKIPFVDIKSPFYAQLEDTVLESLKKALSEYEELND
ncbi:anti-phage dCTP deaminase [Oceaniradius stylonematis]|uniref:anti-phage dCTP deaminase n=1 Tax=Oceaniradius stylonematis TaxID=2184161 RepID=UPI00061A9EA6|nr:anti-phage dCTP deaminase [Oceaniradius stylonematis]